MLDTKVYIPMVIWGLNSETAGVFFDETLAIHALIKLLIEKSFFDCCEYNENKCDVFDPEYKRISEEEYMSFIIANTFEELDNICEKYGKYNFAKTWTIQLESYTIENKCSMCDSCESKLKNIIGDPVENVVKFF